jgi:hypothetical protein
VRLHGREVQQKGAECNSPRAWIGVRRRTAHAKEGYGR